MNKSFVDLENIVALLPGHVYWLDRNNVYQGCNDAQAKSAGLTHRNEIVGKRNKDLPWNKNKKALVDALDAVNKQIMETGVPQTIEEPGYLILDNQKIDYVSYKVALRNGAGEVIGLLGISLDITNRKIHEESLKMRWGETEFALESILANMPGHVYWKNKEGVYLGCNDRQARSLGLNSGSEVISKTDFDLPWPPGMAEVFRKNDLHIIATGETELLEECAQVDGKDSIVLSQKTPLRDKEGEIVGVLGISIDITKLKETEKMLSIAKEKAEAALKAKEEVERALREKSVDLKKVLQDMIQHKYYLAGKYKGIYLTKREAECLICLARNMSVKEIAKVLGIKPRTVEMFLESARGKLNCHTKSQLVQTAIECRFLEGVRPMI